MRAVNVDRQTALDAIDHDRLDRLLLVVRLLNFFPGVDALRLLVRQPDVSLLGFALIAHDIDFVAGLELWLALVVQNFREREHAFRLCADVDYHVRAGELQHRAFDDAVFADRFFGLSGEGLERGGEILAGSVLVVGRFEPASLGRLRAWCRLNCCSSCSQLVGSASVTTAELESEWGSVVSSNKVMPL